MERSSPAWLRPDFSFVTADGELILWEHLGMMVREDYRKGWEWKKAWYEANGFGVGRSLFTSQDDERGGLDWRACAPPSMRSRRCWTEALGDNGPVITIPPK